MRAAEVLRPALPGLAEEVIATIGREVPEYARAMDGLFGHMVRLGVETALGRFVDDLEGRPRPAGERRRRRRRLVDLLAADPPAPAQVIRAAAADAGWEPPRELAALVAAVRDEDVADAAERLARELGPGVLAAALDDVACALVPDPGGPGRRARIEAVAGDLPSAIGPSVGWPSAGHSIRRAVATLRLVRDGRIAAGGVASAAAHLPALLIGGDRDLAADLARDRLAPLEALTPAAAARQARTLRAWLDRPGQVQAVAVELGVHPQTVRYRVRHLRELFGEALEDPEGRFELALALRARALA